MFNKIIALSIGIAFTLCGLTASASDYDEQKKVKQLKSAIDTISSTSILDGIIKIEWPEKNIDLTYATNSSFDEGSLFEWGSITKTFTALATLSLIEENNLNVNDPVKKFLKGFKYEDVTIKQLLDHTSGLPRGIPPYFYTDFTLAELLEHTKEIPMLTSPGEKYNYSNLGYIYLRLLIEEVSGKTYADYLDSIGLSPYFSHDKSALLTGYTLTASDENILAVSPSQKAHSSTIVGASGLYGSLTMLSNFVGKLADEKANPSSDVWASLFSSADTNGMGSGLNKTSRLNNLSYFHTGRIDGFQSIYEFYPELGLKITVLLNNDKSERNRLMQVIRQILFEADFNLPTVRTKASSSIPLNMFIGNFQTDSFTFKVSQDGDRLFVESHGDPRVELFFFEETKLFSPLHDLELHFKLSCDKIANANFVYYGQDNWGKKLDPSSQKQ